ncbi:vasoactive intestinal polypeptide receptor 2-like [Pararge aegeria]|uniref:vasoactive intestinal polypeptide receptor 2-like n=1 Tax=Pararge aegeria TaxID=116150 RepID=UPI0019D2CD4C|nr:vasoactive intestinal polypeptide receptor 2-like [Pararge aegeria]
MSDLVAFLKVVLNRPPTMFKKTTPPVFFDEELARKICMYIGFGVPVIFDFSYAAIRLYSDDTLSCMCELPTMPVNIIEIPIWCSVMLCLGITVIAIYVTLKKNRNSYGKLRKTKLTIRRSLALFPVFGLHLLLHFIKPPQDTLVYEIHEIVLAVLTSFQGFYLAMFFCFTNPEVLAHLKRYYEQRRAMNSLPKRTANYFTKSSFTSSTSTSFTKLCQSKRVGKFQATPPGDARGAERVAI